MKWAVGKHLSVNSAVVCMGLHQPLECEVSQVWPKNGCRYIFRGLIAKTCNKPQTPMGMPVYLHDDLWDYNIMHVKRICVHAACVFSCVCMCMHARMCVCVCRLHVSIESIIICYIHTYVSDCKVVNIYCACSCCGITDSSQITSCTTVGIFTVRMKVRWQWWWLG